jgi:hypothetical protein
LKQAYQNLAGIRQHGGGTVGTIGLGISVLNCINTGVQGWYAQPLVILPCLDVSRPMTVSWTVTRLFGAIDNVNHVGFEIDYTIIRGDVVAADVQLQYEWSPPFDWLAGVPAPVNFLNAGGPTFPAHTFVQGDFIGFRYLRNGLAPADQYPPTINIPNACLLAYNTRCPSLCC